MYKEFSPLVYLQPGQSFERFKEDKMKKFDKNKDQKFNKQEVKKILAKSI